MGSPCRHAQEWHPTNATSSPYYFLGLISGVLRSTLSASTSLLLAHLPPYPFDGLNWQSRSILFCKRRVEGDEKKRRDVEWEVRWGEVRWGEVRWGEVRWGEVRWGEVHECMKTIQLIMWGRYMSCWWRYLPAWDSLGRSFPPSPLSHACLSSVHLLVSTLMTFIHQNSSFQKQKEIR